MKNLVPYFQHYLDQLCEELAAYPNEEAVWQLVAGISNSSGTLTLHLIGNLHHFIGHGLGKMDYIRDRPAEFNTRNVPRVDLVREVKKTRAMVTEILTKVENPDAPYPEHLFGKSGTTDFFLYKLLTHLSYHIGQINYHRRILSNRP